MNNRLSERERMNDYRQLKMRRSVIMVIEWYGYYLRVRRYCESPTYHELRTPNLMGSRKDAQEGLVPTYFYT